MTSKRTRARMVVDDSGLTREMFAAASGITFDSISNHCRKMPENNRIAKLFWSLALACQREHPETFDRVVLSRLYK